MSKRYNDDGGMLSFLVSPRSIRRHQTKRIKYQVLKKKKEWNVDAAYITPKSIGKSANTRTPCSCWMCSGDDSGFVKYKGQKRSCDE